MSTGLTPSVIADAFARKLWGAQPGAADFTSFWEDMTHLNRDVFITFQVWTFPVGICCWLIYGTYAVVGLYGWCRRPDVGSLSKSWLPVFIVSAVMGILYLTAPDAVGNHGGYLKPRLAIVLPVLWLALLRPPSMPWAKYPLLAGCYVLVAVQLACTCSHFAAANRLLSQYLAGIDEIGRGHVIYVIQSTNMEIYDVSYLLHASNYYCLDSGCTNLDNYEATAHYFPVRFRPGIWRGRGGRTDFAFHPRSAAVDRILAWEWPARPTAATPHGFRAIYRLRSLTIYERTMP